MSSVLQLPAEMEIQEVKAEQVIQLLGSKDGLSTQELSRQKRTANITSQLGCD